MFRSCEMSFCNIYIQEEAAFHTLTSLGHLECVEFLDANSDVPAGDRRYTPELCRCAKMESKLQRIEREMIKDDIFIVPTKKEPSPLQHNEMVSFENTLEDWENDLDEMEANHVTLMKNYLQLTEMYYVLESLGPIFGATELLKDQQFVKFTGSVSPEAGESGHLTLFTGVVRRARSLAFETMLWRISHSNLFYKMSNDDKVLKDPITGQDIRKVAFIIMVQGEQLSSRVQKICDGFKATLYNCPRTLDGRENMKSMLEVRISDMGIVLRKTNYHRCKALRNMGRTWIDWMNSVKMSKAVYYEMNLFSVDITKKCLIGNCWIPTEDLQRVQDQLKEWTRRSGAAVDSFISVETPDEETIPPTHYHLNRFTRGFQNLIDAYGDSAYREVNPGLYTVITFPFLFAMMFGDVGHAFIMTLFAVWMCVNERKFAAERSKNEIWNIFFNGRYIILMMGFFSMFTGFVYNDVFAKVIVLKSSGWRNRDAKTDVIDSDKKFMYLDAYGKESDRQAPPNSYWLGVDPAWSMSKNMMVFQNSLKMKISIVVGVIHMIFGIVMSVLNHLHFKHTHAIFLEFIPQMLFLCCLFFYLVFMMFFKWFTFSMYSDNPKTREGCAPLILIYFIDMVLMRDTKPIVPSCNAYMYDSQEIVQKVLLFVALACVPIMLCGTPCYRGHVNKRKRTQLNIDQLISAKTRKQRKILGSYRIDESLTRTGSRRTFKLETSIKPEMTDEKKRQEILEKYPLFSDLIITQAVHTIEFVLSTVSHTASYLRLWALSLAHAQLAHMLWDMVLAKIGLHDHELLGCVKLYIVFAIWASFTVTVMVLMEGLSAFLHTLRLHWVEFMSKFFIGGGVNFKAFSFNTVLYGDTGDDMGGHACSSGKSGPGPK